MVPVLSGHELLVSHRVLLIRVIAIRVTLYFVNILMQGGLVVGGLVDVLVVVDGVVVGVRVLRVVDRRILLDFPVFHVLHVTLVLVIHQHSSLSVNIVIIMVINVFLFVMLSQVFVRVSGVLAKEMGVNEGVMDRGDFN